MSASLIGRFGSSTFRLSTTAVSMSLTGSRFSSESAPRPFQHGIRGRGETIYWAALLSAGRLRSKAIHRPSRFFTTMPYGMDLLGVGDFRTRVRVKDDKVG